MLSYGDTGNAVTNLQHGLFVCAYTPGAIDGIYGSNTAAAVQRLQAWHGITQDGIYGAISEGCLTGEVKKYQYYLGLPQDGIASYVMQNAVRAFQAAHPPLVVDGIIGHYTDAAFQVLVTITPAPQPPAPPPLIAVAHRPWCAFNTSITDPGFECKLVTGWISYQFPLKMIVDKYRIKAPDDPLQLAMMPKDWTFHGFNGSNWVLFDTQVNQDNWAVDEEREFLFTNINHYPLYRLKWTANNGATRTKIDRLSMFYGGGL